jgi:hypothetical protein
MNLRHPRLPVIAVAVLGLSVALGGAQAASAAATRTEPLPCHASVSNREPRDFTTVDVLVKTADNAHVRTVAHYRTTNHPKTRQANAQGKATVPYFISGATPGFKVKVTVTVSRRTPAGKTRSGSCATSYTPQHG